MDYKTNLRHPEKHANQLIAYKEAIQKRTAIPYSKIKTATFNEHSYFEFR